MFFMARATEPILRGWLGSMRTMRTRAVTLLFYRPLMQPLLNIGMRAARRAGDLIVRSLSRLDSLKIDSKSRNDFVTDIDGTTNFLHGFPTFAVSIAVEQRGRLQHAVVYDPMRQEFFTASRGDGAQLEGKKIRVSAQR